MIVNFASINVLSCSSNVNVPKTSTKTAVTTGTTASRRVSIHDRLTVTTAAIIRTAVAVSMPTLSGGRAWGRKPFTSQPNSAGLALAAKNSASGPSSSANLTHGLSALRGATESRGHGVFVILFPHGRACPGHPSCRARRRRAGAKRRRIACVAAAPSWIASRRSDGRVKPGHDVLSFAGSRSSHSPARPPRSRRRSRARRRVRDRRRPRRRR